MDMFKKFWLLLLIAASIPLFSFAYAQQGIEADQKSILITGTSSGFGRLSTEYLTAKGYFIYAGVLNDEEAEIWADNPNVKALILDVTKPDQIAAAVRLVEEEGRGLYGVVNNAGVVVIGAMTEMPEAEFDRQLDINLYGPYRITKAFAPMIIESKGRITNISSVSGISTSTAWGAYSISKHGLEAYSDTLAAEMRKFDVSVSLVEPGPHSTNIGQAMLERLNAQGETFENSAYRQEIEGTLSWADQTLSQSGDPMEVVKAIEASLSDENPKARYLVVSSARAAQSPVRQLLREAIQLNQDHQYSMDEAELVEILKDVLAEQ